MQSANYDGFETEPRFRVGFGRANFAENLAVWDAALAKGAVPVPSQVLLEQAEEADAVVAEEAAAAARL
jgi:hypothetical protein